MSDEESRREPAGTPDDAEAMARLQEEISRLPVSEHVAFMMHSLSSLAVERMGLAGEGVAQRDLEQARLAIDAFKALLVVLEQTLPPAGVVAQRGILSQLQFAYVGALGGPTTSQPAAAEAPVAPVRENAAQEEAAPEQPAAPKKAAKPRAASAGTKSGAKAAGGAAAKGGAGGKKTA